MAKTIDLVVNSNGVEVLNKTTVAAEGTAEAVKSLNKQYSDLKKQQEQYKPNTKEFKELTNQMIQLKKQMKESADAVNQNAQPAIEGLRSSFSMMREQIMNLDFEGLSQSVNLVAGNLGKLKPSDISKGFSDLLTAGKNALKGLGQAIKANPIFFLASAIIGVIVYWKELEALVGNKSGMIQSLKQQVDLFSRQTKVLERNVTLLKSTKASAGEIYQAELDVLNAKDKQLTAAYKLALLEGEQAAISESRAALEDTRAEKQAKLNATIAEGHSMAQDIVAEGNKDVALQQAKIKASQQYIDDAQKLERAISEQKKQQENLNVELAKAAEYAYSERGNTDAKAKYARRDLENTQAKVDAQEKLIKQSEKDLKIIKAKGIEVWNNTKTAEEQAKIDEAAAVRKAQREAEAKKLADELLAIKKELADWDRRNLSDLDKELFLLNQRQKLEVETYKKAKKSAEETAALLKFHQEEEQAIRDKYAKIQSDKENQATQQRLNAKQLELIELQDIIDAADEANFQATLSKQNQELIANKDYYFNLITQAETAGLDTAALIEEQGRKENEIKDKYRKEDEAKQTATQEFRLKQLSESLGALSALNDAFTKKGQEQSKKQFKIQKALNLASAVVDTYGGINRALNDKTMPSTTARIIQASIVGAMGLANVLKISKTEYGNASVPSGTNMSAGGGDNGGTMAPSPANYDFISQQPNQQPPLQAYIVGSQVSSNLEAQQLIQNQSRLGG